MIAGLLFAGYDTTCNQLGHALFTFTRFPDQWALLAEHPELAGQAVDEVMRLHGAIIGVPRITTAEVEVDGWVIPPGTVVFLSLASANRDETVFDEPLRFDITAQRPPHLSFGGGPHYCLGANLARAEMEEALRILPGRLPRLHLDGDVEWRTATAISGPSVCRWPSSERTEHEPDQSVTSPHEAHIALGRGSGNDRRDIERPSWAPSDNCFGAPAVAVQQWVQGAPGHVSRRGGLRAIA